MFKHFLQLNAAPINSFNSERAFKLTAFTWIHPLWMDIILFGLLCSPWRHARKAKLRHQLHDCVSHRSPLSVQMFLFLDFTAELRRSVRDGGDAVGVGPRLRPRPVQLRSRPKARYAAAEIHRWGCLFFLSAPPFACLSVLWTSGGLHCADLFVRGQQCLVSRQKLLTLCICSWPYVCILTVK